jgi:REP element-mobilizing transposase RayT
MTRTVNGERLFENRDKEVLRKMIWQVASFCGVEVLTYCIMSNHFHVLVRIPVLGEVSDKELLRRYQVLYPKPTKYQTASVAVMVQTLAAGGEEAEVVRLKLLARMGDVSEFMKAVKQRFSVCYNRSHGRYGTLWAERFKSVLVEGKGNPLQTMAAYIDLNPVRAGIVKDPKNYRFCGYAEAVVAHAPASKGLRAIWADRLGATKEPEEKALEVHRELMFGERANDLGVAAPERERLLQALEDDKVMLPKASVLRCRVRYFTDGAILGSQEYVRGFVDIWQVEKGRKNPPKANPMKGADWGGLTTIQGLRRRVFE